VYDSDRLPSIMIPPNMARFLGEVQANIQIIHRDIDNKLQEEHK